MLHRASVRPDCLPNREGGSMKPNDGGRYALELLYRTKSRRVLHNVRHDIREFAVALVKEGEDEAERSIFKIVNHIIKEFACYRKSFNDSVEDVAPVHNVIGSGNR